MRALIAWGTYPVGISATVAATWWGIAHAAPGRGQETLAVALSLCALSALMLVLQRVHPRVEAWEAWRQDFGLDVAHGLMSTIGGATLARLVFFGGIAWLSARAAEAGWGVWPDHWPLLLQLPLAVVISDGIVYWLHRASHRVPALWRLHELHHTSERLYALSSGRTHPVYVALSTAVTTAPLLALGADPPILALLSAVAGANGIVQHSNVALRCEPWA
ncbi:MAG: sterol desaturase family protein [Myxococcota bacterium]